MKLIPRSDIHISPGRQRKEIDPTHIQELADSIQDNQLFHPIVIADDGELLAGECRLRAMDQIWELDGTFSHADAIVPSGMVPATTLGDLTPLKRAEVELDENIRRRDISWQDRVAAVERVAKLKTQIAKEAGVPTPSNAELAQEIYTAEVPVAGRLVSDMQLARNLDHPEVAKAKTKEEAVKVLKRLVRQEADAKLAETVGATWQSNEHELFNANSLEWMATCAPETFDVILTDPPYGMGADSFGDSGGMAAGAHGYSDDATVVQDLIFYAPQLFWNVLKPEAHLYLFCDLAWFGAWKESLEDVGFTVFRTPLIWHKPNGMRAPWPEHGPWRRYETILYAMKGRRYTHGLFPDVITATADENLGHAAQKPVALFEDLLRRSVSSGDRVLDPFCGSGPIFPAAESLRVRATGVEMDPVAYGIALRRLGKEA